MCSINLFQISLLIFCSCALQISEIIARFERKGFKLVAIKLVIPSKDFAEKHYHDLKERPFFNGLCDFLSSGPVLAMVSVVAKLLFWLMSDLSFIRKLKIVSLNFQVWEGEGVIKYGRKLIGATDPQKSEPGTIRGDLAVVVGRYVLLNLMAHFFVLLDSRLSSDSQILSYTSHRETHFFKIKFNTTFRNLYQSCQNQFHILLDYA